jgi:hypothetical protein
VKKLGVALLGLAACGGSAKKTNGPAGGDPKASMAADYEACGIWTTKDVAESGILQKDQDTLTEEDQQKLDDDPATQTPKDVDACLRYVRVALVALDDTNAIVGAGDIAYGLCDGATANGEACYWRALYYQTPTWNGQPGEYDGEMVNRYLQESCDNGWSQSCAIIQSGVDDQGRQWLVGAPAEAEPPEAEE